MLNKTILTNMMLITMSIIMMLANSSWFSAWCCLELNSISFIALMSTSKFNHKKESMLKYFIVQATSSYMMILSMLFMIEWNSLFLQLTLLSLMLKIGSAPFHFWFTQISEGMEWNPLFILMTVQKLIPMTLLSNLFFLSPSKSILIISAMSGITGAVGGLNEISLHKLLSFSSINHMGWLLISIPFSMHLWMNYLMFYSIILLMIILPLKQMQLTQINQLSTKMSPSNKLTVMMSMLSLGGLPPLLGFFPKVMVIMKTINLNSTPYILMLIMSSTITLYYYMRINNLTFMKKMIKQPMKYLAYPITNISFTLNLSGLVFFPVMMMFMYY